jgi:WD40 repeat protein
VNALASWEGWLLSGSADGRIRAWDAAAGRCDAVLDEHTDWVSSLALSGPARLVSGAWDRTVRVWRLAAAPAAWRLERTLEGHGGAVYCVAAWGARAASGSADRTVRVWRVADGGAEATLRGHAGAVTAVAADGARVVSAGDDGAVRVWDAGTWTCAAVVRAHAEGSGEHVRCLGVSGTKLVGGSYRYPPSASAQCHVRPAPRFRRDPPPAGRRGRPTGFRQAHLIRQRFGSVFTTTLLSAQMASGG